MSPWKDFKETIEELKNSNPDEKISYDDVLKLMEQVESAKLNITSKGYIYLSAKDMTDDRLKRLRELDDIKDSIKNTCFDYVEILMRKEDSPKYVLNLFLEIVGNIDFASSDLDKLIDSTLLILKTQPRGMSSFVAGQYIHSKCNKEDSFAKIDFPSRTLDIDEVRVKEFWNK